MGLKLSELDGIVFDMDGVIFDSEVIGLESWEHLGKKYGLTRIVIRSKVNPNKKKVIK